MSYEHENYTFKFFINKDKDYNDSHCDNSEDNSLSKLLQKLEILLLGLSHLQKNKIVINSFFKNQISSQNIAQLVLNKRNQQSLIINTPLLVILAGLQKEIVSNSDEEEGYEDANQRFKRNKEKESNTEKDIAEEVLKFIEIALKEDSKLQVSLKDQLQQKLNHIQQRLNTQKDSKLLTLAKDFRKLSLIIHQNPHQTESKQLENLNKDQSLDLIEIFSSIKVQGFDGQVFLGYLNKLTEELQLPKYTIQQLQKSSNAAGSFTHQMKIDFLQEIDQTVKRHLVSCLFDLYHSTFRAEREPLLLDGSRDEEHTESLNTFIQTQTWVIQEFKSKAVDMLSLDSVFGDRLTSGLFKISQFMSSKADGNKVQKSSAGYLSVCNEEVLKIARDVSTFKHLQEQVIKQGDCNISRRELEMIKRYFKQQVDRLLESSLKEDRLLEENILFDSLQIEDNICFVFGVSRHQLCLAILQHNYENEFYS